MVTPGGNLIFSQEQEPITVWSLPLSARDSGAAAESLAEDVGHFSVSRDGETLVYGRLIAGSSGELVVRNLETRQEKIFAEHDLLGPERLPHWGCNFWTSLCIQGGDGTAVR